jgi:nuclear pore complex protein Nup155
VRALVARAAEACFLLRVLSEHNIGRLAARMEEGYRAQLRALRFRCALLVYVHEYGGRPLGHSCALELFSCLKLLYCPCLACVLCLCREWVSSEDGEGVATQLISVLVAEHLSATGGHLLHCMRAEPAAACCWCRCC